MLWTLLKTATSSSWSLVLVPVALYISVQNDLHKVTTICLKIHRWWHSYMDKKYLLLEKQGWSGELCVCMWQFDPLSNTSEVPLFPDQKTWFMVFCFSCELAKYRSCCYSTVNYNIHVIVIPYVSNSAIKCHMLKTPDIHKLYPIVAIRVYPNVMYGKGIW